MAGKICDVCGTENEPGAAFCVSCHSYLAWDETGLTVTGPPTAGGGYPTPRTQQRARLVDADELFQVFAEHAAVTVPISGEPATFTVQVNNTSSIVDGFTADAPTAPPWLAVQSTQVDLLPGSSGALSVTMRIAGADRHLHPGDLDVSMPGPAVRALADGRSADCSPAWMERSTDPWNRTGRLQTVVFFAGRTLLTAAGKISRSKRSVPAKANTMTEVVPRRTPRAGWRSDAT
jgi:hypothetical protein